MASNAASRLHVLLIYNDLAGGRGPTDLVKLGSSSKGQAKPPASSISRAAASPSAQLDAGRVMV